MADQATGETEPANESPESSASTSAKPPAKKKRWAGLPTPSARRWGMNPEDRMRVMEACLVLPSSGWVVHFALMMAMSVIVAIMGLSANSAALVIGAMLIAPLMTPVLGIAASISMALGDAAARAALTVSLATAGAIGVSYLVAAWLPGESSELLTNEVLARTAPDARDLVVALAAGIAGSYATARPDVSSSLPGVAIAVALVPPLAVVGITMRAGEADLALGALLLYATNLAAIVTVSTIVFVAAGFVPGRRLLSMAPRVIAGGLIALVLVAILGVLLGTRSQESANRSRDLTKIRTATEQWLGSTFNEFSVNLNGNAVEVTVTGPDSLPSSSALKAEVEQILNEPTDLEVTWIQGQTSESLQANEEQQERTAAQAAAIREVVDEWLASTGDLDVFDLTALDVGSELVTVSISSTVQPPPLADLLSRLEDRLGEPIAAQLNFEDLSASEGQRLIAEAETEARRVVQDWAAARSLDVDAVSYDGTRLVVDVRGENPPDGASLQAELSAIVGPATVINVYFIERVPVIPAPTPTPTPEPTPTPVPTPTPEPTATPTPAPTPDADTEGSSDTDPDSETEPDPG